MTKFKKCDYCKLTNKTVTKYKSSFPSFGEGTKARTMRVGVAEGKIEPEVFYLCKACFEFLIPEDKLLRNNKIDNDFFESELRKKVGIKYKTPLPLKNMRHGSVPNTIDG